MYRSRLNNTEYINRLPGPPSVYYPIPEALTAFDALWSLALGLDRVQRAVCANDTLGCNGGPLTELEDIMYYNVQLECMINKSMEMTGFQGVSVSLCMRIHITVHYIDLKVELLCTCTCTCMYSQACLFRTLWYPIIP